MTNIDTASDSRGAPGGSGGLLGTWRRFSDRVVGAWDAERLLRTRVRRQLAAVPDLKKTRIEVEAWRGSVILRGDVPSAHLADLAGRAAREVPGVLGVDNLLHVTSAGGRR
jgi:hypothetical protein